MSGDTARDEFDRLDRRIGRAWSRFWGMALAALGAFVGFRTASDPEFTLAGHWPGLGLALLLFVLARLCLRSREGMLDLASGTWSARARKRSGD